MKILRFCVASALILMVGAASASAQTSSSVMPRGSYTMVPDSNYAGPDLTGLAITFGDDNTMTVVSPDGSLIVKSKLTFENGVMTLNDQDGSNVCQAAGKYKVVGDAKTFRLSLVEDGCSERSAIVIAVKWVRLG